MKTLRGFAWTSTLATFLLIFTGGLVRVSGAGLGCPDWPKCFGRWLPPTSIEQLPPDIDPSLFNFTLAWIEYGNRMLGALVGILILITAILAIKDARRFPRIWIPAVASLILVAYVGWQGGQVVASGLEPFLVAIHMLLSLTIALALLYTSLQLRFVRHPYVERRPLYPSKLNAWLTITSILAVIQTILGTQLRGAIKVIRELEPLGGHSFWTDAVGPISVIHQLLGVVVALLVMHNAVTLIKRSEQPSTLVFQAAVSVTAVAMGQIVVGLAMIVYGYMPLLQVFHLWLSALLLGSLLILFVCVKYNLSPSIASYQITQRR
ncbi:COX15/CtaA family protein [bacterium]|nr:COX15/CtaA family protein [bacterium]